MDTFGELITRQLVIYALYRQHNQDRLGGLLYNPPPELAPLNGHVWRVNYSSTRHICTLLSSSAHLLWSKGDFETGFELNPEVQTLDPTL